MDVTMNGPNNQSPIHAHGQDARYLPSAEPPRLTISFWRRQPSLYKEAELVAVISAIQKTKMVLTSSSHARGQQRVVAYARMM